MIDTVSGQKLRFGVGDQAGPSLVDSFVPHLGNDGIGVFMANAISPPWPPTMGWCQAFVNFPPEDFSLIFRANLQLQP